MTLYAKEVLTGRAYTATSGNVRQGFSGSSMVPFALYNPPGSNVNCVIWKASMCLRAPGFVTFQAGSVVLAANPDTDDVGQGWGIQTWGTSPWGGGSLPSTGVDVAITPCFIGNSRGVGARARAIAASGATGVTVGALTLVRPLWIVNRQGSDWPPAAEDVDFGGEIVLAPGTTLAFTFAPDLGGAATAELELGITWSELTLAVEAQSA